jgi:hypothetical protein
MFNDSGAHHAETLLTSYKRDDLILPQISVAHWKGIEPNRFPSNKRHAPAPLVLNPEGHHQERRHYASLQPSPSFQFRSSIRKVDPIDHSLDREVGATKVIKNFVIVKPKIDRVPKINPRLPPKEPVTLAD